jgi:hypothetical protein
MRASPKANTPRYSGGRRTGALRTVSRLLVA